VPGQAASQGSGGWGKIARRIRVPMGFVFAALFLWLARPTWVSLAWSLWVVVPGIWLRAYASGYVKKNAELAVTGPYAYTRNPLYLGSMLIAFGFAGAARNLWIVLVLALLFAVIYVPTIRSEEEFLRGAFPNFDEYARRVPRLLPRITPAPTSSGKTGRFSRELYRKHREYNALLGAIGIYAALLLRIYFEH
jgi:protein-S-isoprenylcysteine O-methyltransferase Ste14